MDRAQLLPGAVDVMQYGVMKREVPRDPSDRAGKAPAMVGSTKLKHRNINGFLSLATSWQIQLCRAKLSCDVTLFESVRHLILDTLVVGGSKYRLLHKEMQGDEFVSY